MRAIARSLKTAFYDEMRGLWIVVDSPASETSPITQAMTAAITAALERSSTATPGSLP